MSTLDWKPNWQETRKHFIDWWRRDGLVVTAGTPRADAPHEDVTPPPAVTTIEDRFANVERRCRQTHYALSRRRFPADTLPIASTDIGPAVPVTETRCFGKLSMTGYGGIAGTRMLVVPTTLRPGHPERSRGIWAMQSK